MSIPPQLFGLLLGAPAARSGAEYRHMVGRGVVNYCERGSLGSAAGIRWLEILLTVLQGRAAITEGEAERSGREQA